MNKYKAFLFDLNGTVIDDMDYHITAWHKIFNELGAAKSMEETKLECYGKNHEVIERVFPGRFSEAEKDVMSIEKEKKYQDAFRPHLKLIEGLDDFLKKAYQQRVRMAIGSAAITFNIDFVLDGLNLRKYFDAIVSADDITKSKPDPETFLKCAKLLNAEARDCLVFEDSPKGTESALHAEMKCVALTTMHQPDEFNQVNIIKFIDHYTPGLFELLMNN
jgi:HAD superfamily hydrolase (TIGR01509 family)